LLARLPWFRANGTHIPDSCPLARGRQQVG
jgi:hypothetical protein